MTGKTTKTTCPYCGVGCGVLASSDNGKITVKGDPDHPANFGRLCSKGSALHETVDLDGRLLHPIVRGERTSWNIALNEVAQGFRGILDRHGPEAVALYVSGQLLTEDYYVANKLIKGFLGSANIDTNSRLCMASSVAGHKRAFGSDTVPGCYEDLELADLVVLVGSNAAWCHPILYQRVKAAKELRGTRIVVIDPRNTETCEIADLHLSLKPGTDVWLFNGLLAHLAGNGPADFEFLERHVEGCAEAVAAARGMSTAGVAEACGLSVDDVQRFYQWFAATERTVSIYSQGVNQSSAGTDKVNAIINCHLLTGRIGKPGMGPLSVTGQPNAMGGREVGGLANQLACHMDFTPEAIDRVGRFWQASHMAEKPGLKAVDLFEAVGRGEVKAVWIMGTNPAVSMPDADAVRRALAGCELVVVSDCMQSTDTAALAHVLLPATGWAEKEGSATNSERRISRQRAFLPPAGEAKPDWWILTEVARRMGFGDAFPYRAPSEIFSEYAALSAFENDGTRDFDIGGLQALTQAEYDTMAPFQWPRPQKTHPGTVRFFADGRFFTPSGRARMIPTPPRGPVHSPDDDYPLALNTGRVRDHWHTMTRTGKSPRLNQHIVEPFLTIHPHDALKLGVQENRVVQVRSRWGQALLRARFDQGIRPGHVFAPMHWNDQFSACARIDAVVNPVVDPVSGEPEFKHTPVRVQPVPFGWYGFLLSRVPAQPPVEADYWTRVPGKAYSRLEFAGVQRVAAWWEWARLQLPEQGEWLEYQDSAHGFYRAARIDDGQLLGCVFIGPGPDLPPRQWLAELIGTDRLASDERLCLLSGRPPSGQAETGRIVCACFGVGETVIRATIVGGAGTPAAVTRACKAGGNCGSCIPEIRQLIAQEVSSARAR